MVIDTKKLRKIAEQVSEDKYQKAAAARKGEESQKKIKKEALIKDICERIQGNLEWAAKQGQFRVKIYDGPEWDEETPQAIYEYCLKEKLKVEICNPSYMTGVDEWESPWHIWVTL